MAPVPAIPFAISAASSGSLFAPSAQPPWVKPSRVSSSADIGACMTPSREMLFVTEIMRMFVPFVRGCSGAFRRGSKLGGPIRHPLTVACPSIGLMPERYATVDEFLAAQEPQRRADVESMRALVHEAEPSLTEIVKW